VFLKLFLTFEKWTKINVHFSKPEKTFGTIFENSAFFSVIFPKYSPYRKENIFQVLYEIENKQYLFVFSANSQENPKKYMYNI